MDFTRFTNLLGFPPHEILSILQPFGVKSSDTVSIERLQQYFFVVFSLIDQETKEDSDENDSKASEKMNRFEKELVITSNCCEIM
jgi:hypothetical protein